MKDICDAIDETIIDEVDCQGIKFFGLAELAIKANQPHPVTINDRKQVSINDRYNGIFYHRFISDSSTLQDNMQWGNKSWKLHKARLRSVLATKVEEFSEEFVFDFANAIPSIMELDGYKSIDIATDMNMIVDQESIYKTEFGTGDYEKYALSWNIYAMEYNVEFLKC